MATSILDAFEDATLEDLAAIEAELDAARKKVDGLEAMQRVLKIKFEGKAKRAAPRPRDAAAPQTNGEVPGPAATERREAIAKYLLRAGLATDSVIGDALGIPSGSMTRIMDTDWFKRHTPSGKRQLTDEGLRAAKMLVAREQAAK